MWYSFSNIFFYFPILFNQSLNIIKYFADGRIAYGKLLPDLAISQRAKAFQ